MYNFIILPLVLYVHETQALTLMEENNWGCLREEGAEENI
jgi:hypothetical protein